MQLADVSHVTTDKALLSTSVKALQHLPPIKRFVDDVEKLLITPDNNAQPEKQHATTALRRATLNLCADLETQLTTFQTRGRIHFPGHSFSRNCSSEWWY